jgi:hypothetical protein
MNKKVFVQTHLRGESTTSMKDEFLILPDLNLKLEVEAETRGDNVKTLKLVLKMLKLNFTMLKLKLILKKMEMLVLM